MLDKKRDDPASQLIDMVDRTRKAFDGIATLAPHDPQYTTRDKGVYAYLFAKPTRRLATALAVDREILTLFTSFNEQQQRTVKIARELIGESAGRLEPTVVVVVHKDAEGNSKLTRWGRSLGLAVLPVYYNKLPTTSDELLKQLCYELFSHDPFDVTGPVSDDENFFGRRNEALDLARKLQTGQIRACLGIRKIGKTSVINRVIHECRKHHNCCCVFIDCSKDEIWSLTAEGLLTAIGEAIHSASSPQAEDGYSVVSEPVAQQTLTGATKALLGAVQSAQKPVIIFIDEVDYITPSSPTSEYWKDGFNKFWRNFRSVYQEAARSGSTISVMIGGVSAKWFIAETINQVENAALAFIPEEYLSPLDRPATRAMIKKISKSAGLMFSADAADLIGTACSDIPFWVRKACSFIHRRTEIANRPASIDEGQTSELVKEFITTEGTTLALVALSHLLRVYPELRDPCLKTLECKVSEIEPARIAVLKKYGILSSGAEIRPSGTMVLEALKQYKTNADARPSQGTEDKQIKDASGLTEWAEDLALVNRTRNLLERKMRQAVLNFLQADSMTRKLPRGSTKARVLSALAAERKEKVKDFAPDELMEKLYWKELSSIVLREWVVFAGIFSDKRHFEESCTVVNERPDAHAKNIDPADIALQKRALTWLNERLTSV
jgi:hypothetical protein